MSTESIVTDDIGLAVTVDISPLSPGASMSAPSVQCWVIFVVEGTVSSGVGGPMSTVVIVTDHVGLAITVNVSVFGVGSSMSAPALGVVLGLFWVPPTTMSEHGPMVSSSLDVTGHVDLSVTGEVGESSPGSGSLAPSLDVSRVDGSTVASVAPGHSVPMSAEGVGADLVRSSISLEVGVVDVGSGVSAPCSTELVGSGVCSGDEIVVEFALFLEFVGSDDGCE